MKTVVIVDNNTEILRQVEDLLNKVEGINVIGTAEDGEKGILKIRTLRPDIVITDIKMPKVEGTELIEFIAKHEENYIPHFIVITSQEPQTITKLNELPIRRVIYKPFRLEELIKEVVSIQEDEKVNVIIADDDVDYCNKLKEKLVKYENISVLGIANTDEDEISMIEDLKPDIVITDLIRNHEFTGRDIIEKYNKENRKVSFFVISYTPECANPATYENVKGCMQKYEIESNFDELAYRLRKIKKSMVRKTFIDDMEQKEEPKNKKSNFFDKIRDFLAKMLD